MAVMPDAATGETELWVVNDHLEAAEVRVEAEIWSFAGDLIETIPFVVTVAAGSTLLLGTFPIDRLCPALGDRSRLFLNLRLTRVGEITETHHNQHFFSRFKSCELAPATVKFAAAALPDGRFRVTLTADHPAFWVWANVDGIAGEFDDNSLAILPGCPLDLDFQPEQPVTLEAFSAALNIRHLQQTYES
jgi:hypothetical protein